MKYSREDIIQYIREDDVKFIRLSFCDVFGKQKNISIMPGELKRAFEYGIAFDASAIDGFGDETKCDLLLHPDCDTLMHLPWRPEHGKVVKMFSDITYPDGRPFERDTRMILKKAVKAAEDAGFTFSFGAEQEFYLFKTDDYGEKTDVPYDDAGYMDLAPEDRGENVRREICLTLEQMGIRPESSHHEEGPGQNEIDFRYSDALTAADNALTFQTVVKAVARYNGLAADFSAKPLDYEPGNGFHINISVKPDDDPDRMNSMIAGILDKISEMTIFLNPCYASYKRFGKNKAPSFVSWSNENRSQLIRIPAAVDEYRRIELRSPDPESNPYLAFALIIYACLYGIENKLELSEPSDFNLFTADLTTLSKFERLPSDLKEAAAAAHESEFIKEYIPDSIISSYCNR